MNISPHILDKQVLAMTGREVLELFQTIAESKTITRDFQLTKYVYGLNGLAKLLGCGKTKAQEIKSSGILDGSFYQNGRTLVFDAEKVMKSLENQ